MSFRNTKAKAVRAFCGLMLLWTGSVSKVEAADVDIYMIGNSYTDDSGSLGTVDDMILFAESATRLFGDRFDVNFNVTSTTFGGRKLYEHWQQVPGGNFAGKEHIVLQEQSQFLAYAFGSFPTQLDAGQNFFDLHRSLRGYPGSEAAITNTVVDMVYYGWFRMFNKIINNAPNSTVHIFQTWGRTSGYIGGSYDEHIRRNVIMADDIGAEGLGCYGSTIYTTPNLDRMAREGVQFKNAYATPLCTPTRVMIMSGLYPNRTGFRALIGKGQGVRMPASIKVESG